MKPNPEDETLLDAFYATAPEELTDDQLDALVDLMRRQAEAVAGAKAKKSAKAAAALAGTEEEAA